MKMQISKILVSVAMLAACHVSALPYFPLEELVCDKAFGKRGYIAGLNGRGLPWMNMTVSHSTEIPPGMLMDHGPQFIKHKLPTSPLNDTAAAQDQDFQLLAAEPPWLDEIHDLWARFELLECWDANQRRGWYPGEWNCAGVTMWVYGTYGWCDPFDTWDQSNNDARKVIADPNNNIRSYQFKWERKMGLTVGARGWYPH